MDEDERRRQQLAVMTAAFTSHVPHNAALGLQFERADPGDVEVRMAWRPELVGNPDSGVLHGGVLTSLADASCGAAVFLAVVPPRPIATLDLRIEHLRQPRRGHALTCHAVCERITQHIAFVRATIHDGDPDAAVALASASFMIFHGLREPGPAPEVSP
ncbi:MAG: PaaI family thioesterase [Nannocystaceae bacterium]|nr:PaaI family thioesterase [Nannocystaceae bacterium]